MGRIWEGGLQLWGWRGWWTGAPRGSSAGWRWRPGKAGGCPWRLKYKIGAMLPSFSDPELKSQNSPPLLPSLGWVILLAFGEKSHSPCGVWPFSHFFSALSWPHTLTSIPPWQLYWVPGWRSSITRIAALGLLCVISVLHRNRRGFSDYIDLCLLSKMELCIVHTCSREDQQPALKFPPSRRSAPCPPPRTPPQAPTTSSVTAWLGETI